jgi:E3 ubiquitin-protein ligase SHPRH
MALRKNNISYSSPWNRRASGYAIHTLEIYDEAGNSLLSVPLSMDPPGINNQTDETIDNLDDIFTSLAVNRNSVNSPYDQGRLWTEVDIVLLGKDESDYIQIFFTLKWNVTTSPEYIIQKKKTQELIKVLETYFPNPAFSKTDTFSAQEFYNCVHSPEKEDDVAASIETDLNTDLYPFQKRAVQWLLRREGLEWAGTAHGIQPVNDVLMSELPNTFRAVTDIHGQTFYVSHLFGIVTFDLEPFFALETRIKGGILAEEMGLGKTVEMIALMTLHKRSAERSLVFDAYTDEDLRPTGATLIISPVSISSKKYKNVFSCQCSYPFPDSH